MARGPGIQVRNHAPALTESFLTDWQILIGAITHWLAGGDPYGPFSRPDGALLHPGAFAYPPPTLLLGAPFALLPWAASGLLMIVLSVVGFEIWAYRTRGRSALLWLVIWLPVVQGLWIGQTTLLALVGLALAELAYRDGRDRRAGLLLALALLKPQTVVLAVAWLLWQALRARRWGLPGTFLVVSVVLWGGVALVAGPQIYLQWIEGLRAYGPNLPNRPLVFPPYGPALATLALLLWHRRGRADGFGAALLLTTLIYPLSVVYVAAALVFVVIRWRPDAPLYPLALSWLVALLLPPAVRTPDSIAAFVQLIVATGLLPGLLPRLPTLPVRKHKSDASL